MLLLGGSWKLCDIGGHQSLGAEISLHIPYDEQEMCMGVKKKDAWKHLLSGSNG